MQTRTGPICDYLVLVVFILLFWATESESFDEDAKDWGLCGTVVGVATGAGPGFFTTRADNADGRAKTEAERAEKERTKAEVLLGAVDPSRVDAIRSANPSLVD